MALTGKNRIMNIPPTSVHQRVPCILGSRDDILEMRRYYVESNDPELIARCKARLKGAEVLDDDESSSPIDNLGSHNSDSSLNEDKEGDTAETIGEFGVAK